MPNALGIKTIMGVAKESTYATTPVDATDRVPLLSENIDFQYQNADHDYLYGGAGTPQIERIFEPVAGPMEAYVPYTAKSGSQFVSASLLIALAMGTVTWDAGQGSNKITFKDDIDTFGTYAWNKFLETGDVMEAISMFINSFTLSCASDAALKMSLESQGYDLGRQSGTTQNQYSELQALPSDVPNLILLRHFIFRVGDQAGALADGDRIGINSFTITVNNNLTEPTQSTIDNASSHTDAMHPIQPVRNGFREVTLEVTIPRYSSDTLFDHITAEDDLQADLLATHPSTSEEFDIIFPHLKLEDVNAPIEGPGASQITAKFRALRRNSASDMTFSDGSGTDNGELWIETDDERTAAIF